MHRCGVLPTAARVEVRTGRFANASVMDACMASISIGPSKRVDTPTV
jgi:hypothetical protein